MGFLTEVEQKIDTLLRRVFPRRPGDRVQPVEIAREMIKAMEGQRTLSVDTVYVPNVYRALVHPDDFAALRPVLETVKRDASTYVEKIAEKRGLSFAGPVRLEIEADERREPGDLTVTASFQEEVAEIGTRSESAVTGKFELPEVVSAQESGDEATRRFRPVDPEVSESTESAQSDPAALWLEVTSGPERGLRLRLEPSRTYSIGRVDEADLTLSDSRVSKRHAEVRFEDGKWWVVDLDSTNGTRKNGRTIARDVLATGDEVAVGLTTLRVSGASKSKSLDVGLERA